MSVSTPPSGSTSPLAFPGAILAGRYRLEEMVGQGGMGSVWRATHTGLGEQVAVKLVSANFVRSPEALRRFDTEAKSAAKLRSRHVPHVFDNGVLDDGTPYLVMELLHGESLAARLGRLGPISLTETVSIVEQCCRALSRAHSLGIVHRDIKPENVYLAHSVDDEAYVVKVLDFGIAKVTSLTDEARSSTRTGTLLGTPLYMSPEQARGLRSIDSRTDLYSLGLVTYTMLTGGLPFSGESLGDLLLQICTEPLPRLRAAAPSLPVAMENWFQRACARQPEDRFPSAQALVEALRIAAGISTSRQNDPMGGRIPGMPGLSAADETGPAAIVRPGHLLHTPSTTAGTSVGALPAVGGRRARWVLVIASAVLGLTVAPLIVLLARGRAPVAGGNLPATGDRQENAIVPGAPRTFASSSPDSDAEPNVALVPLAPPSARPTTSAPADKTVAGPGHPPAHPVFVPTSPPPQAGKPPATSPVATKPTGAIDLGY
jgi:hypothetical protein